MLKFEKLAVWQKSLTFGDRVHAETRDFPTDERFGLTNRIPRAALSISSNIAEGSARSDADIARFVTYASGSLYEVVTQAFIARRQGLVNEEVFTHLHRMPMKSVAC